MIFLFTHLPCLSTLAHSTDALSSSAQGTTASLFFSVFTTVRTCFTPSNNRIAAILKVSCPYLILTAGFFSMENCVLGGSSYPSKLSYCSSSFFSCCKTLSFLIIWSVICGFSHILTPYMVIRSSSNSFTISCLDGICPMTGFSTTTPVSSISSSVIALIMLSLCSRIK